MKKHLKSGIVLTAVLVVGGAFATLSAREPVKGSSSPVSGVPSNAPPPSLIFNRKLASTTQSYGDPGTVVGSSFVAIDSPLKFTCPNGGCTVSAEENVQVSGTVAGNRWAICATVDGNFMAQPNCPFQGYVTSDGSYVSGSFVQNMSAVTAGPHTLQTFLYTDDGATLANYNITYRLYTP